MPRASLLLLWRRKRSARTKKHTLSEDCRNKNSLVLHFMFFAWVIHSLSPLASPSLFQALGGGYISYISYTLGHSASTWQKRSDQWKSIVVILFFFFRDGWIGSCPYELTSTRTLIHCRGRGYATFATRYWLALPVLVVLPRSIISWLTSR